MNQKEADQDQNVAEWEERKRHGIH